MASQENNFPDDLLSEFLDDSSTDSEFTPSALPPRARLGRQLKGFCARLTPVATQARRLYLKVNETWGKDWEAGYPAYKSPTHHTVAALYMRLTPEFTQALLSAYQGKIGKRFPERILEAACHALSIAYVMSSGRMMPCTLREIFESNLASGSGLLASFDRAAHQVFSGRRTEFPGSPSGILHIKNKMPILVKFFIDPEKRTCDFFALPASPGRSLTVEDFFAKLVGGFAYEPITQAKWSQRIESLKARSQCLEQMFCPEHFRALARHGAVGHGRAAMIAHAMRWDDSPAVGLTPPFRKVEARLPELRFCDCAIECRVVFGKGACLKFDCESDLRAMRRIAQEGFERYEAQALRCQAERLQHRDRFEPVRDSFLRVGMRAIAKSFETDRTMDEPGVTRLSCAWAVIQAVYQAQSLEIIRKLAHTKHQYRPLHCLTASVRLRELSQFAQIAPLIWTDEKLPEEPHPYSAFVDAVLAAGCSEMRDKKHLHEEPHPEELADMAQRFVAHVDAIGTDLWRLEEFDAYAERMKGLGHREALGAMLLYALKISACGASGAELAARHAEVALRYLAHEPALCRREADDAIVEAIRRHAEERRAQ